MCASTPGRGGCHDVAMSSSSPATSPSPSDPSRDDCARPATCSDEATAGITAELDEQIGIAARLMHTSPDPAAIADAIEAVPADAWDESTLRSLRTTALDIGRLLRAIAAAAEEPVTTTTTSRRPSRLRGCLR